VVRGGGTVKYPIAPVMGDRRFTMLARNVGLLLEQHAYDRLDGEDRDELEKVLYAFLYGSRGAAGELEKRLNGTAAPLVSDEGKLDSYDCLAAAHELRRVKGAQGALVIAMGEDGHLRSAVAAEEGSMMDIVGNEVINNLGAVLAKRGWKAPDMQDVAMEFTVGEGGKAS
jgi:hypothetical protein